jgi:hypothetical protein
MHVLVKRVGDTKFVAPEVSAYENEAVLQRLIAEHPEILPGVDPELPWVAVRELPMTVGRADVVIVDVEAKLTICECKLRTNPEVRRAVIGQIVSYAGALSNMRATEFERRAGERLGQPLIDALDAQSEGEFDRQAFRAALEDNFAKGDFRLLIVVDEISDELRDAVLFLNEHSTAVFLALELGYLREADLEILIPTLYGQEMADRKARTSTRTTVKDADTVVVAATRAFEEYKRWNAYICQPATSEHGQKTRTFRPNLKRLAFYHNKQIEPVIPKIDHHYLSVPFTAEEEARLMGSAGPDDRRLAQIIGADLTPGSPRAGHEWQVFLLSAPGDRTNTLQLRQAIAHQGKAAWTQHQRYTLSAALESSPLNTDELTTAEQGREQLDS